MGRSNCRFRRPARGTSIFAAIVGASLAIGCAAMPSSVIEADLCIYGGTSGGVVAAVAAARLGKSAVLVAPNNHLGGMTSGGLGVTDRGVVGSIGGISREFYRRVGQHYGVTEKFEFEPHVAEQIFGTMIAEAGVPVFTNQQLASVTMSGRRIAQIVTESGAVFRAEEFIDATYEGDLMAAAGASFVVGREGTNTYGESLAGVRASSAGPYLYDPYVEPGNPASGLLPLMQPAGAEAPGQGDHRVQAYNFRLCLTSNATNRITITAPTNYSEAQFELVARYIEARVALDGAVAFKQLLDLQTLIPNGKTDINARDELSTDFVGASYPWATNTPAGRAILRQQHEDYLRGFLYFLATSARVPANVRSEAQLWGLAKDEFQDTGGWPHQIYVREARRMVGDYVMTQANCEGRRFAPEPVGLGTYSMDSHFVQRVPVGGAAGREGGFFSAVPFPYGISYRSIVPRTNECENVFATFAVSASHVAFGSVRMEPVFMILSQSAATAAAFAIDDDVPVQAVSYPKLAAQLRADEQILDWTGGTLTSDGVIVDDGEPGTAVTGSWAAGANAGGWNGDYVHDQSSGKGTKSVRYLPNLPTNTTYDVYGWWVAAGNRASNVPYDIIHSAGTNRVLVDQTINGSTWVKLISTNFAPNQGQGVIVRNEGTAPGTYVVADAVRFVPVGTVIPLPKPVVEIVASDPVAGEFGTNTGRVSMVRSGATNVAMTVTYQISGSATPGADFGTLPGSAVIPAGAVATSVIVTSIADSLVEGDESVTFTLVSSTNYGLTALSNVTVIVRDLPIDQWRMTRFDAAQQADPQISSDLADPDGDGLSNLMEYALGLAPLAFDSTTRPRGWIEGGVFWFEYTREKSALDVALALEYSDDLQHWQAAAGYVEEVDRVDEGSGDRIRIRLVTPVANATQDYVRLRAQRLAP